MLLKRQKRLPQARSSGAFKWRKGVSSPFCSGGCCGGVYLLVQPSHAVSFCERVEFHILEERRALLAIYCQWGVPMVLGMPVVVDRTPCDLGEESAYLHHLLLLSWGSVNARLGLLSSVEWHDIRHSAAVFFLQSWESLTSSTFDCSLSLVIILSGGIGWGYESILSCMDRKSYLYILLLFIQKMVFLMVTRVGLTLSEEQWKME